MSVRARWYTRWTAGAAAAAVGGLLANAFVNHTVSELVPYNVSEFLISYGGGFVRRGLIGEILYRLPGLDSLSRVELAIKLLSGTAYGTAFALLLSDVYRHTRSLVTALLVVLQPFLFGFPVLTFEWLRKDVLLVLVFYLSLRLLAPPEPPRRPAGSKLAVLAALNILSLAALLSHEMYGFVALPLLVVATAPLFDEVPPISGRDEFVSISSSKRALGLAFASYTPVIVVFAVLLTHKGDAGTVTAILGRWAERGVIPADRRAIGELGLSFAAAMAKPSLKPSAITAFWLAASVIAGFALSLSSMLGPKSNDPSRASRVQFDESCACILTAGVCCAPLFVLGSDFGRWVFIWMSLSAGLMFSDGRHAFICSLAGLVPLWFRDAGSRFSRVVHSFLIGMFKAMRVDASAVLVLSLLALPVPALMMEACCNVFRFSLLSRVLRVAGQGFERASAMWR